MIIAEYNCQKVKFMKLVNDDADLEKRCLECGNPIFYGRSDKKFCSVVCKNQYHNRESHASMRIKRMINGVLEENYRILESLIRLKVSFVPLSDLVDMGFDPSYFTSYSKRGCHREIGCYDISYCMTESKLFNLRRTGSNDGTNTYICDKN